MVWGYTLRNSKRNLGNGIGSNGDLQQSYQQKRLVKAERARAVAVSNGAAEKRALRVQLMGAQKAATIMQQEAAQQLKVARQTIEDMQQ
ncbi:hypothetical protein WJX84_011264 [Apatococcus fuscideae]|uniref:Uncharacterized protein n=1 Tax=Apatococcus fuscideae TaxID=2026836 RepID=A0AAW1T250_9CHLO